MYKLGIVLRVSNHSSIFRALLIATLLLSFKASAVHAQATRFVDPRIAAGGDGATIPGPAMPFGMVKPGPDVGRNNENSGWSAKGDINGFSQTHVSGTGGGPKYGNILIQPTVGEVQSTAYSSPRQDEQIELGSYAVTLARYNVRAEIASSTRAAIYRFTYPETGKANILFDTSHCLTRQRHPGDACDTAPQSGEKPIEESQHVTASEAHIVSPTEVAGSTTITGGWNRQTNTYTVYFDAVTDTPAATFGTWQGNELSSGSKQTKGGEFEKTGAWLQFATHANQQVTLKIGISFISEEQARKNLLTEIPAFDFAQVRERNIATWSRELSAIDLHSATDAQATMFYTALYHAMLMPVDRTGENPLWQSQEPYYDDFYTLWDTFRTTNPLLTLIAPGRERDIVRSLIDTWRHEGWLPDGRSGNFTGNTQGGSNAEMVLGDAYAKHLPGIDWNAAYEAMQKDAEATPPEPMREGRGGIDDWKSIGYVSIQGSDRPASKTMEYAANDYELALMAKGLGREADYGKYLQRSGNWQNLWDASYSEAGIHGFIRPRNHDGSWKPNFNADQQGTWGGDDFYEDNSRTYSLDVPQDVHGLIEKCGGKDAFIHRLDEFFSSPHGFDAGNEPGFLTPYLYIWAGRQDKTAAEVRHILASRYRPQPDGIPGNDDAGAISAWYIFGLIGIYPNAGQDVYLIGSPAVPEVTLHVGDGKTFTIEAKDTSAANQYIQSAMLNGKPFTRAWLTQEEITSGGRIVFQMGPKPANWATGQPPPSSSDTDSH
ncbi:GH92 family glycosyl hydrolase [Acidicapsa dinghuensis]|uniref:GH92 family glycosyl hydrolase n=1 Tax=Acidicapsa dinghuensis TaxID=2218256 RepID=A0ABW1EIF0_9BACT|nr:GH92 family glycosyl hydrolase [Acidicapsa dinghuensis]